MDPEKKPRGGWTYAALNKVFGGSNTEAASYLATNICKAYFDPSRNNHPSPLPRFSVQKKRRLRSDTNPEFLDSPLKMPEDRCSRCHRYKKNSPTPDVSHVGSAAESKCKLDHHPAPCDFLDDEGGPCTAVDGGISAVEEEALETAKKSKELEAKFSSQEIELQQMKAEMQEMRKMVGALRPTANPRDTLLTTASTASSVTTETTTSFSVPRSSILPPNTGSHTDLVSAAQSLIQMNEKGAAGGNTFPGYSGPSMKDLQGDNTISDEVQRQLQALISSIPALQKVVAGQPPSQSTKTPLPQSNCNTSPHNFSSPHVAFTAIQSGAAAASSSDQDIQARGELNLLDMDSMLGLTVREKQYRPHEFASRGNFFYAKNINDRNITLPLYMYGYLKHCVILMSGLVNVAEGEVMARLVNLMNICEITSNNSTLNDFDGPAWQLGRGYGDRVFNDIQQGLRSWTEMPNHILPDVFLHVKDMVDVQTRKKEGVTLRGRGGGRGKKNAGQERSFSDSKSGGEKPMVCTSYNDFFTGSGCAYEFNNNKKCSYEHYCSKCFAANGSKIAHKGRFCQGSGAASAVATTSG